MKSLLPSRYWFFVLCLIVAITSAVLWQRGGIWPWLCVPTALLSLLGFWDLTQTRQTLRRNFPVIAHGRYLMEEVRPMLRQYVVEGDNDEVPFSHDQRSIVYQRAKQAQETRPFGSELSMYGDNYEWINHSILPARIESHEFRVTVGGPGCSKPYSASVFNISAMSFGSLSPNAVLALNEGARRGGFYHDTGEGSLSKYHREPGGDVVWELGSGYFGACSSAGVFSAERFVERAHLDQVKMIEVKLSQGAKPGHGGILPGAKVSAEIAATRGIPEGVDCVSPSRHSEFDSPVGLLQFIARLRELSGGKPTGFKLAIGHPWEWFGIAKAMRETGLHPDFIVVDGAEGGTGAAPMEFLNHVGVPMREGLLLVHNTLVGLNLRDEIRIGAAGKIITAFDIARTMALGADWCNAARGFMFALGCIQSMSCHTDRCPTGITTQDPRRWHALHVPDKAERVFRFHHNTLHALKEMIAAAGLDHPSQLGPEHILRRISATKVQSLATLYPQVRPGELIDGLPEHVVFQKFWADARADSFAPPAKIVRLRESKLV